MTPATNSFQDSLKQIIESLQARFLLPSIILTVGSIFILSIDLNFSMPEKSALLICTVIIISYLFNALNGLIIRLMEGYEFSGNILYIAKKKRQIKALEKLNKAIDECRLKLDQIKKIENKYIVEDMLDADRREKIDNIRKLWEDKRDSLIVKRSNSFPPSELMSTTFGNIIKAWEYYPKDRYNIDAVYLWPRMFSILKDKNFLQTIQNEKITLDFLANTGFVFIIFFLEFVFVLFKSGEGYQFLLGGGLSILTTCLLFYAANAAARDWGTLVCSAFDLYRYDLYEALYLPHLKSKDIDDEKAMWGSISEFIIYGDVSNTSELKGFNHSNFIKPESAGSNNESIS